MDDKQFSRARQRLQQSLQRLVGTLSPLGRTAAPAAAETERSGDNAAPKHHGKRCFADSLYGELLLELPMHRRRLFHAHQTGDTESLRKSAHQLLGAVVYCDAPELEQALRELRLAIKTGEQHSIDIYHDRAISEIDSTLRYSGLHGQ